MTAESLNCMKPVMNRQSGKPPTLYGAYIRKIAGNILGSREDTEECVNEALFRVWNTIPPKRPKTLSAYLALITREVSIDAFRKSHRKKRADSDFQLHPAPGKIWKNTSTPWKYGLQRINKQKVIHVKQRGQASGIGTDAKKPVPAVSTLIYFLYSPRRMAM